MKGIYLIRCKSENKVYIGQSNNIKKRFSLHLANLRKNKHSNSYLQQAFNKYGENDFTYEVIFELKDNNLDREKLYNLEIYYISLYHSNDRMYGYNIESGGKSFGRVSDETKRKIGNANRGNLHSEETKKRLSEIRKGKPSHWKGKKQTKEHSEKRIKQQFGKVWVNNGVINKFVTKEESKILLTQGFNFGRTYFTRNTGKYEYNGKKYSLCEIARICGINRSVIFERLKLGWSMEKATNTPVKHRR